MPRLRGHLAPQRSLGVPQKPLGAIQAEENVSGFGKFFSNPFLRLERALQEGREEIRKDGRKEGRKEGMKEGRNEGRKEGRKQARKEGRKEVRKEWIRNDFVTQS